MGKREGQSRPASIYDVAAVAGVSYQTVSRVINGAPHVSRKTRALVLEAITALDFHPSRAARAFSTGRSRDIAVVIQEFESYGWTAILSGVHQGARESGRDVMLHEFRTPVGAASWIKQQTVESCLLLTRSFDSDRVSALLPSDMTVLGVGDRVIAERSSLTFREHDGAVAAASHLIGLGHRRIAIVTVSSLRGTSREDGWRETLEGAGIDVRVWECQPRNEAAFEIGRTLQQSSDATAVLCANDEIAIPLMAGVRAAGGAIPETISVVGFDDHPLSRYQETPLTTVRQDFHAAGRRAVNLLGSGARLTNSEMLPTTLIVRRTTQSVSPANVGAPSSP